MQKVIPPHISHLYQAFLLIKNTAEMHAFLQDLCTPQEIQALAERWRVCQLLEKGDLSYREIHRLTGASLTTIGRVSRFLKEEQYGGYKMILNRLKEQTP